VLDGKSTDLVLCGAGASDTSQGIVAPMLAGMLGHEHVDRALEVRWREGDNPMLRVTASGWQGHELDIALPCVVAVEPGPEHVELSYDLHAFVAASTGHVSRIGAEDLGRSFEPMPVWHSARPVAEAARAAHLATTPEAAAAVFFDIAGLGGSGGSVEFEPYKGDPLGFGQQPNNADPACLFVCEPVTGGEVAAASVEALSAADGLARGTGLPLDVVLPVANPQVLSEAAGRVIGEVSPRRIYVLHNTDFGRFGWKGHLEWLQEFWGMYRGEAKWLLGPPALNTLFARFAGQGPPGVDRCWPWFQVQTVSNGSGPLCLGSAIFDGAGQALAVPPMHSGLRIATFASSAEVELEAMDQRAPEETQVYSYEPRVEYDPASDAVASLLDRLGGGELTLEDAEYVVDVGYGAGGHDDMESLAKPLLALLVEDLGLSESMIGATRKVTQDLETLPVERQIGQTGVRVDPKVVVALAVSGAPQHIDWIGDSSVILSFNIDAEAPLMKLNEQRSRPVVHPIVGDVRETIPRFIAALRDKLADA
jgi:hypothetical protein